MITIHKYELPEILPYNQKRITIETSYVLKILKWGVQSNKLVMWAIVNTDPSLSKEKTNLWVIGTGVELPQDLIPVRLDPYWEYIDTVFQGSYVWHIFG